MSGVSWQSELLSILVHIRIRSPFPSLQSETMSFSCDSMEPFYRLSFFCVTKHMRALLSLSLPWCCGRLATIIVRIKLDVFSAIQLIRNFSTQTCGSVDGDVGNESSHHIRSIGSPFIFLTVSRGSKISVFKSTSRIPRHAESLPVVPMGHECLTLK